MLFSTLHLIFFSLFLQAPSGYYSSVDFSTPETLRATVHAIIKDHQRYPYTSDKTDTWDILEDAQTNPDNTTEIISIYHNAAFEKQGGGNDFYDREHSWPKSYGFPDNDDYNTDKYNYPYTDCHHLFLADSDYNLARSNKPYDTCSDQCEEYPTDFNNERGGESGVYPGNSNWTSGDYTNGTWEVWDGRKGDIARAMFYMAIRYEGGTHSITGAPEPDLELTDDRDLIHEYQTQQNEDLAYMGILTELLKWNHLDPPDDMERNRNDVIYSYQGNRNPFIDHPEWADYIFKGLPGNDRIFNIPHIAGPAWNSQITLYNPSNTAAEFTLNKWDESGNLTVIDYQDVVPAFSSLTLTNEILGVNGVAQVMTDHPDLNVKVSFQFGSSESLTEFFASANKEAKDWFIPNTQTSWFEWFGTALGNLSETETDVTLKAYFEGELVAETTLTIAPHNKSIGVSNALWEGINYKDVDMVTIHSSQPIPAPIGITGNQAQTRHVFFLGQETGGN